MMKPGTLAAVLCAYAGKQKVTLQAELQGETQAIFAAADLQRVHLADGAEPN